jgi:uncharacterized membrane protein (UPF0127 family)
MRTSWSWLALLLVLLAGGTATAPASQRVIQARPLDEFPRERIAIETRSARRHLFDAWRADTDETRAQGLMFVERLDPAQAMLFVYEPPQLVSMWMRNTVIALDMLFVDEHGCIVKVAANTTPLSLKTIASPVPVTYVLEIRGGDAASTGIAVGDRLVRTDVPSAQQQPRPCTH